MQKILKEEILKAEDKAFFHVLDHQCVPSVVEVEEEEGDGGWQDGGIAQRGCITHGDKRLEVRVFSSVPPMRARRSASGHSRCQK